MIAESIVSWQYISYLIAFAFVILMKIVCFILGYFIIRLGYMLIDSGAKGEFKFSASFGNLKGNLASVSPGLLFVLLGVFLISYAIYVEKEVKQEITYTPKTGIKKPVPVIPNVSPFKNMEDSTNEDK